MRMGYTPRTNVRQRDPRPVPRIDKRTLTGVDTPLADNDGTRTPTQQARTLFAKRLWRLMTAKGWNQAELGRRAGLGRDVINHYINERALPTAESAKMLADALGITVSKLFPGAGDPDGDDGAPVHLRQLPDGKAELRVNMIVSYDKALRVLTLLQEPDAA